MKISTPLTALLAPEFRKPVAICSIVLAALLGLTVVVGWFFFGWGYIRANKEILHSLPVPPGAQLLEVHSSGYTNGDDLLSDYLPPDGWRTSVTYRVPLQVSRKDVLDFYVDRLLPEWQYCTRDLPVVSSSGGPWVDVVRNAWAHFDKGRALVDVDLLTSKWGGRWIDGTDHTYSVSVEHQYYKSSYYRSVCQDQ